MDTDANIEIVTSYFDRMTAGDIEGALALLDDDGSWWSNQRWTEVPMAQFKQGAAATLKIFHLDFTILSSLAVGDKVVMETTSHAVRPDGGIYENVYCWIITVADGKLRTVREYADTVKAADLPAMIKGLNRH